MVSRLTNACLLSAMIAGLGCEKAKAPSVSACELLAQERNACDASVQECSGELAECNAGCVVGLACVDLLDPSREPGAIACLSHCAPKFTCNDGTSIPKAWKCDNKLDCADGEDEGECE